MKFLILVDINIFRGIHKNNTFAAVIIITLVLQAIIIEFGGLVFKIVPGGLNGYEWLACILLGIGSLLVGLLVRQIPDAWFTCMSKYSAVEEDVEEGVTKSPQGEMKLITPNEAHPINAKQASSHSLKSVERHGRVQSLWKQVIGKTQMQVRVIKAFRDPHETSSSPRIIRSLNQGKSSNPYKSRESVARTNSSQPPSSSGAENSTVRSGGIVDFVRGGRTKASDYVSLQIVDVNSARKNK